MEEVVLSYCHPYPIYFIIIVILLFRKKRKEI